MDQFTKEKDPVSIIKQLEEDDVLINESNNNKTRFSGDFKKALKISEETVADLDESELHEKLLTTANGDERILEYLNPEQTGNDVISEYLALDQMELSGFSYHDLLRLLPMFDTFRLARPNASDPDPFMPIQGDRLPVYLRLYSRAVVFIWRDECRPCETMSETFEEIYPSPPEDIALFSVYGPNCPELLVERYAVHGGPASLFFREGIVETRMYGAKYRSVIESEIAELMQ